MSVKFTVYKVYDNNWGNPSKLELQAFEAKERATTWLVPSCPMALGCRAVVSKGAVHKTRDEALSAHRELLLEKITDAAELLVAARKKLDEFDAWAKTVTP